MAVGCDSLLQHTSDWRREASDDCEQLLMLLLQEAYSAACLAELNVLKIQNIVKKETAGHAMATFKTLLATAASIAEQTIRTTDHPFMAKCGKVLCPKAHLPEV
eukprot:2734273-Ditylum_brightwellii.AAC.1